MIFRSLDRVAQEVQRFESTLAVLIGEIIKFDAPIWADILDTESTFLSGTSGHHLGLKCNLHFRTGPHVC